jgi:thiamine monophosphate synthase
VTGSAGKTTTREAIASVLALAQPVFKNSANYSGRFGLPIAAIGGITPENAPAVPDAAADLLAVASSLFDVMDIQSRAKTFGDLFLSPQPTPAQALAPCPSQAQAIHPPSPKR